MGSCTPPSSQSDLPAVMRVYDEHNARRTLTTIRSEQYWRDGHSRDQSIMPRWVAEIDGEVVAYLQGSTYVREVGYLPGHVEALYRLACVHMWTRPHRAERYMRKVIRRDKRHALALSALGLLLGMRGSYDQADRCLRRACKAKGAGATNPNFGSGSDPRVGSADSR